MEARDIQTEFVGPIGKDDGNALKTQTLDFFRIPLSCLFFLARCTLYSMRVVGERTQNSNIKLPNISKMPELGILVRPKSGYICNVGQTSA